MTRSFSKPGFEFIFSLSLIAILGLPPVLKAQTQKDLEIKIENGDTTINGKNIKDLSASDRKDALKDIHNLSGPMMQNDDQAEHRFFYKRKDTTGKKEDFVEFKKRRPSGDRPPMMTEHIIIRDSTGNIIEDKNGPRIKRNFTFRQRNDDYMPGMKAPEDRGFNRPERPMMRFDRKNTQSFNYVNTDAQGMSTHISFHISEPMHEDLQKISGIEGAKLEIADLSIVPEFNSGKTVLMFTLPKKAAATVFLKDGEGKLLWTEKSAGGGFSKSFSLPLNGIYYLHIKQANSVAVKKIVKEE